MTDNSSTFTDSAKLELLVLRHGVYIVQGLTNVIFNSLIVVTILRHSALREAKEYVGFGAAATADVFDSLAALSAGLYRIPLFLSGAHLSPASSRECLLTAHNALWALFGLSSKGMMVVLSLDRIWAVAAPIRYYNWTRRYMIAMSSVAYGMSFVLGALIFVTQWPKTEPVYTAVCYSGFAFGMDLLEHIRNILFTSCTVLSIGLYGLVPILYYCRSNNSVTPADAQGSREAQLQQELNKSVSLSCLFTFVRVALPWFAGSVALYVDPSGKVYNVVGQLKIIIANIDPMVNLWVYYKKQQYFRKGFKAFFQNKTLPMILDSW